MCKSAPTSSPLQQSSALQQMWACRLGHHWEREHHGRRGKEGERAHCSWRMRPVFQRQVRFCPKVVIRPHKHLINSLLTCTHANTTQHTHTQINWYRLLWATHSHTSIWGRQHGRTTTGTIPTSVVWHRFVQSLFSPSQTSHTSPPAPGQTVYASQWCHIGPGERSTRDK